MSEIWLIVTLCVVPTLGEETFATNAPLRSSDCAEYRVERSFPSFQDCQLHQIHLNSIPLARRRIMASLCTAQLDPERIGEFPLLSQALGNQA